VIQILIMTQPITSWKSVMTKSQLVKVIVDSIRFKNEKEKETYSTHLFREKRAELLEIYRNSVKAPR